jgi:hypothetical protein
VRRLLGLTLLLVERLELMEFVELTRLVSRVFVEFVVLWAGFVVSAGLAIWLLLLFVELEVIPFAPDRGGSLALEE